MNINELIQAGAKVEISFFDCDNLKDAFSKIKPYMKADDKVELSKPLEGSNTPDLRWLKVKNEGYAIIAFYNVEVEEHALA